MKEKLLVALDVATLPEALRLVDVLRDHVGGFKVGLELCMHAGPQTVIDAISAVGGQVFVDVKLKDIPNTVAGAARAFARPGVLMYNVHCDGGTAMMRAAVAATGDATPRPLVIGVTVMTSIEQVVLNDELRVQGTITEQAVHLARLALESGLDGIVCSAHEVAAIKAACGAAFVTVVPGVRPTWAAADDQKRIMTPTDAIRAGADYLVIGRPITRPPATIGSPAEAARRIVAEIAGSI